MSKRNDERVAETVEADLIAALGPPTRAQKASFLVLGALCAWGAVAYGYQSRHGLAATAMNNYFSWGVYIVNFVFFIGISQRMP